MDKLDNGRGPKHWNPYGRLLIMAVLSVLFMYVLMYGMVNVRGNVYLNLNQLYMAVLMAVPMVVLELSLMGMMYRNKRLNLLLAAFGVIVFSVCFMFDRPAAGRPKVSRSRRKRRR